MDQADESWRLMQTPLFTLKTKEQLTLYPLSCLHLGAAQCDYKFIKGWIEEIKADKEARWVYLGDGGECVTKLSKGDIYSQLLSPTEQIDALVDLLKPIRDKGTFLVRGNHGHRFFKEVGVEFDKVLAEALQLPFAGPAAWLAMDVGRVSYDCFFHHGKDSGVGLQTKITAAENFARFTDADALFTAHSHIAVDLPPAVLLYADRESGGVGSKLRRQFICGSAYDSRSGYATEKGYPPLLPSFLRVWFNPSEKEMDAEVVRTTGDYELTHEYVLHYKEKGGAVKEVGLGPAYGCPKCSSTRIQSRGSRRGLARFQCVTCGGWFSKGAS